MEYYNLVELDCFLFIRVGEGNFSNYVKLHLEWLPFISCKHEMHNLLGCVVVARV